MLRDGDRTHTRVPNSSIGQALEAGPDFSVQVDVNDWTWLTRVVRSGQDYSQTSLYTRLHNHLISLSLRPEKNLILVNLFSLLRI